MSFFPFFVDIEGQNCLVVGGGSVAFRKVCTLLPFGVQIRLVAVEVSEKINRLVGESGGRLVVERRAFEEGDVEGMLFVIAATQNEQCSRQIADICRRKNILVNVADDRDKCSFYFPSLIKKGELVAGICSGGNSPALARRVRQEIEGCIPEYYAELNDNLGRLRPYARKTFETQAQRQSCYDELIQRSRMRGEALSLEEMRKMIDS